MKCVMLNGDGNENGRKINRSKSTVKRTTKRIRLICGTENCRPRNRRNLEK